jgi:nicotinamide mononucleotide transporter
MNVPELVATAWLIFRPYALETLAVAWGILTVWLTVRQNNWCWPVGSLSNALFAVIFFREKLYADMALQVVYIGLNAYGWYEWRYGGSNRGALPVARTPAHARLALAALSAAGITALTLYLARLTDASLPFWDATTTVLSLAAQYMLARKWIENWWVWITVNVLYIGVYAVKGLYLTSAQQLVFIALSVVGFLAWRKELLGRAPAPSAPPSLAADA